LETHNGVPTGRIIPISKWFVTPIYKALEGDLAGGTTLLTGRKRSPWLLTTKTDWDDPTGFLANYYINLYALQEINISHLGKRKIIFKMHFSGDMLVPWRVTTYKSWDDPPMQPSRHLEHFRS